MARRAHPHHHFNARTSNLLNSLPLTIFYTIAAPTSAQLSCNPIRRLKQSLSIVASILTRLTIPATLSV